MARIHKELYKKGLHDLDNHDDVNTHLEPDILECEVKKASLQTKLVKVMEFQLSYFKSLKMMLLKWYTQYVSKFGKLSSGHRTGKGQFSFQSQRKAVPKNVAKECSNYHTIALISQASKVMPKILQVVKSKIKLKIHSKVYERRTSKFSSWF